MNNISGKTNEWKTDDSGWPASNARKVWQREDDRMPSTRRSGSHQTAQTRQCRLDEFRILIAPGLHDSGPGHWQTRWQHLYPAFERIEQRDWNEPDLEKWSAQVANALRRSAKPAVIVAHSFGCLATVHQALTGKKRPVAALLVAPADPEKFAIAHALSGETLPIPTVVIGSTNDPWMSVERAQTWASRWGSEFINAGALGHINADSGLGNWLYGLSFLQRLVQQIPPSRTCQCGATA